MISKHLNNIKNALLLSAIAPVLILQTGCNEDNNTQSPSPEAAADQQLQTAIESRALTGDPAQGRALPDINDPLSQLGMQLFYTKALSGDMDTACVTCHHPALGGGDNLALSVGVEAEAPELLGPGRVHSSAGANYDGGPTVPRNAPTTFNIGLYDKTIFHDGRIEVIANNGDMRTPESAFNTVDPNAGANLAMAQARFPVTSNEEMKGFGLLAGTTNAEVRDYLQQRVGGYGTPPGGALAVNQWLALFQDTFGQPTGTAEELITFDNITLAIASYERSQVFVNNPWKDYVQGDLNAISLSAKRGALLFFASSDDGGAGCAACHQGGFFSDEAFHVIGMPQVGRGKGNGINGDDDFGRFRETGQDQDRYAFRTPTLLNVTVTGPWGHAGAYSTLEAVVRHHLNPQAALDNFDLTQLDANVQTSHMVENTQHAIDQMETNRLNGVPSLPIIELSDNQIQDLLAFLEALTDPCTRDRACLAPWIPAANASDPDGLRIYAEDQLGDLL